MRCTDMTSHLNVPNYVFFKMLNLEFTLSHWVHSLVLLFSTIDHHSTVKSRSICENKLFIEWHITMIAMIWFLFSMTQKSEFSSLNIHKKLFITLTTLIWIFPHMHFHMCLYITLSREWYITLTSLIWFLLSLLKHMSLQTTISIERLVTTATLMWLLPSMFQHMPWQITISIERITTYTGVIWFLQRPKYVSSHIFENH